MMAGPLAAIGSFVVGQGQSTAGGMFNAPTRELGYLSNMAYPSAIPGPETLIAAWQRGYLNDRQTLIGLGCHGVQFPTVGELNHMLGNLQEGDASTPDYSRMWIAAANVQQATISPEEILVLLNRGRITLREASDWLKRNGMFDAGQQTAFLSLRFQIPTSSDLIPFAVKEAWDAAIVARYGYDDEFPTEFAYWMERQGFGGDSRLPAQIDAGGNPVPWAKLYWRVHWQNISPSQAYAMFQRLRPERMHIYRETLPDVQPFVQSDLEAVLKINDYPPAFRDQLAAIAYNKPRLVDIARFYKMGIIDENEVQALHLDYGYPPAMASMRTSFVIQSAQNEELAKLKVNPIKALLKSYGQGLLTRAQIAERIYAWAVQGTDAAREFAALPGERRQQVALASGRVNAVIDQYDLDEKLKENDRYLKALKRRYVRGIISRVEAQLEPLARGFGREFINRLIAEWDLELQSGRMMASTAQIRNWVLKQILPFQVAEQYLENLGWENPERQAIMAELNRDMRLEFARAQEKMAKTAEQKKAAQERQVRALNAERNRVLQKINATLTPAMAKRYFVRGLTTESELRQQLQKFDYKEKALDLAIKDAKEDREAYLAKKAKERESDAGGNSTPGSAPEKPPAAPTKT